MATSEPEGVLAKLQQGGGGPLLLRRHSTGEESADCQATTTLTIHTCTSLITGPFYPYNTTSFLYFVFLGCLHPFIIHKFIKCGQQAVKASDNHNKYSYNNNNNIVRFYSKPLVVGMS